MITLRTFLSSCITRTQTLQKFIFLHGQTCCALRTCNNGALCVPSPSSFYLFFYENHCGPRHPSKVLCLSGASTFTQTQRYLSFLVFIFHRKSMPAHNSFRNTPKAWLALFTTESRCGCQFPRPPRWAVTSPQLWNVIR